MAELTLGSVVRYKGDIGPPMVVINISKGNLPRDNRIASITMRYFDEFLQDFKEETIFDPSLINIIE